MNGVLRTRVGYAGGTTPKPTYDDMGNHTETLQIDFDSRKVSFEELLEVFWAEHDPTQNSGYTQYKAVLFYHGDEQKGKALSSMKDLESRLGRPVRTEILPYSGFTRAEDYHQKFYLRGNGRVLEDLRGRYRSDREFVDSTLSAWVNGYLGGYGTRSDLDADIAGFGLSPAGREALRNAVRP